MKNLCLAFVGGSVERGGRFLCVIIGEIVGYEVYVGNYTDIKMHCSHIILVFFRWKELLTRGCFLLLSRYWISVEFNILTTKTDSFKRKGSNVWSTFCFILSPLTAIDRSCYRDYFPKIPTGVVNLCPCPRPRPRFFFLLLP